MEWPCMALNNGSPQPIAITQEKLEARSFFLICKGESLMNGYHILTYYYINHIILSC